MSNERSTIKILKGNEPVKKNVDDTRIAKHFMETTFHMLDSLNDERLNLELVRLFEEFIRKQEIKISLGEVKCQKLL